MSVRRSPPPTLHNAPTTPVSQKSANIQSADAEATIGNSVSVSLSEPNLHQLTMNVTERKKRKFDGDDINSFMCSLKEMFDTLSNEQNERFQDLLISVNSLREQNAELTKSVETMSHKYDEILSRIKLLEDTKKEDTRYIKSLEQKIDNLERKTRASGIEIRNIPKMKPDKSETKSDLCLIAQQMGKTLNISIQDSDIKDIYRITAKDSSNPIITEFTSVLMKEKVLAAVKAFNKTKQKGEKLNTTHFIKTDAVKPVFVAETLTQKTQKIFYLARAFQKDYGYDFCWTSRGIVYLRKSTGSAQIKIEFEADLEKLKTVK
ncbi:hypothetical protein PYW08_005156 [Mythimna loreyi]|uniref:Uncharacterized protein n=2 Tax=Mythimna loreyi TaxID=667449 RepID=A0ACC2Q457_9NEOP|nr:hypothetical protein PYW08_013108 [Mythimna loreyi]KAJ8715175.1 hypothetical protein PYW08_005156 [Mythimna loreyi]